MRSYLVTLALGQRALPSRRLAVLATRLWATALPGAYGAGTAGAIIGAATGLAKEATLLGQISVTSGVIVQSVVRDGTITITRGDAATIEVTLGTAFPLLTRSAYFCAKSVRSAANTTAIVNRICATTDAASGACSITLTTAETAIAGDYFYDIEVVNTSDGLAPITAMSGILRITQDVRQ